MTVDAFVVNVGTGSISLLTELGEHVSIPRYAGEAPEPGSSVRIDYSSGVPQLHSMPPVTDLGPTTSYMNMYSIEDGKIEKPKGTEGEVEVAGVKPEYGPFIPGSFADAPIGAKTLPAANGNLVFSGPTAVGMATACTSKVIVKNDGGVELVTDHFLSIQGKTVIVSNFKANIAIEIDMVNVKGGSEVNFDGIKNDIVKRMAGKDAEPGVDGGEDKPAVAPVTYETAFKAAVKSDDRVAFLSMFGLTIAEILCSVQWERVKFRGSQKVFDEVFDGVAYFDSYLGYCESCFESETVKELEFFISPGSSEVTAASVSVPSCEEQVSGKIFDMGATVHGQPYVIEAMHMILSGGTRIEYVAKKRVYSLSHAIIAKKSFVSSDQQGVYSNRLHLDADQISFSNLNFSTGVPDFCDNGTDLPVINWDGDFVLSVTGSLSMASTESLTLASAVEAILAGGTRGIKVDSTGSTALTF